MKDSFGNLVNIPDFYHFSIKVTNFCNLHCEHCTNLTYIPINPNSEYIHRRKLYQLSVDDLVLLCERFKGIGESDVFSLSSS